MVQINRLSDFRRMAGVKKALAPSETSLIVSVKYAKRICLIDLSQLIERFQGRLEYLELRCNAADYGGAILRNALQSCGYLEELVLLGIYPLDWSPSRNKNFPSLVGLIQSPRNKLRKMTIDSPIIDNVALRDFFRACQTSQTLQDLTLKCGQFRHYHLAALGQVVRHTSSLQRLVVEKGPTTKISFRWIEEIVSQGHRIEGKPLLNFAKDLEHNQTLEYLDLAPDWEHIPRDQTAEAAAFNSALQHHYKLRHLEIDLWDRNATPDEALSQCATAATSHHLSSIFFSLGLNKAGRFKFVGPGSSNLTAHDWIESLVDQEDPSIIFFFLRHSRFLGEVLVPAVGPERGESLQQPERQSIVPAVGPERGESLQQPERQSYYTTNCLASFLPSLFGAGNFSGKKRKRGEDSL